MLTRLSRAFLRVFPVILLVVVGLLAALFRRLGGSREGVTTLVPVPARRTVPPARRRGAAVALLVLLLGFGLILALVVGDGAVLQFASSDGEARRPAAALSQMEMGAGRGSRTEQAAPGGATAPGGLETNAPAFDTVRVEPNGDLVVAGRARPNGTVELLVDGKQTARVVADANGQFAIVPPALPAGNSEMVLRVTDATGTVRQSRESVVVAVSPSRDARPLVALTSPDKPTVVLSQPGSVRAATRAVPDGKPTGPTMAGTGSSARQDSDGVARSGGGPDAPADNAVARSGPNGGDTVAGTGPWDRATSNGTTLGSVEAPGASQPGGAVIAGANDAPAKIVSVDAQEGGRLFVSGQAAIRSTVRLYLNDTLIAPARAGRDGSVSFTIGSGVKPGAYKIRLDQVDAASGKVRSRVEVPFTVPDVARIAGTDGSVAARAEATPDARECGKAAPKASQWTASSPDTDPRQSREADGSNGQRGSMSAQPMLPASTDSGRDPPKSEADPAIVFVPEVRTARIERGDSLWAISRRTYGEGDRYTAIYDANQDQIRDPDLIYPGQVFVLPSEFGIDPPRGEKRD